MTWFEATCARHRSGAIEPGLFQSIQTRLRARLAGRLTARDCETLIGSTPEQIAHALSERGYGQEARALGAEQSGARLVRAMIGARLTAEMAHVHALCAAGPGLVPWIAGFTWKYDLARVRAALRARRARSDIPEGGLAPLTNVPLEAYQRLVRCSTPQENEIALKPFQDSPFRDVLASALSPTPPAPDEIEVALVHEYCRQCLEPMIAASAGCPAAQEVLSIQIHIFNLLTVLCSVLLAASPEQTLAQIYPWRGWTRRESLRAILQSAGDIPKMLETSRRIVRASFFKHLLADKSSDGGSEQLERRALRILARQAAQAIRAPGAGPAILAAYIVTIEAEARSLHALATGAGGGVPPAAIRAMLIIN